MTSTAELELATSKILFHTEGATAWITLNQPEKRNAVCLAMWQGIGDALEFCEHSADIRVVVMRGAGGKAFASGADISEFDQYRSNAKQRRSYAEISERGHYWLANFSKPMLALIESYCIGGGLALALNADIRFATPDSQFAIPAARLGLGYEFPGLAKLARLIGPARARDVMFSARKISADEAINWGLINFIESRDEIEAAVSAYATTIAQNAPLTVKAAKAAVNLYERYTASLDSAEVQTMVDACFNSEDYKEGRKAFGQKRPPEFRGC